MRRDDEDLIGRETEIHIPRGKGRPRKDDPTAPSNQPGYRAKKESEAYTRDRRGSASGAEDVDEDVDMSVGTVLTGVTTTWLSRTFQMTRDAVTKRIAGIHAIGVGRGGQPLYALKDVAGRLVDVDFDLEIYLKNVSDDDLPENLRLKIWNAKRARQKFEKEDGDLWHTETLMAVFGEILLSLREKIQQLPDRIERLTGVTNEQYRLFRAGTDEIMDDLYETAMKMAMKDRTFVGMESKDPDEDLI